MKIKNSLILMLAGNGLASTTEHDVPVQDAYKAFRFKNGVKKAAEELDKKREELIKEVGIESGETFDARKKELTETANPTAEQTRELEEMNAKFDKFQQLWKELTEDETDVEGVKPMSYESFHALAKENRNVPITLQTREKDKDGRPRTQHVTIDFFQHFMGDLEGILWETPNDDE